MGFLQQLFGGGSGTGALQQTISDGAFLVDVRTPGEFAEGHVKGSVNIPLDRIAGRLADFKNKKQVVVFCRSGNRSSQAVTILKQNGFTNVQDGGTWTRVKNAMNNQ